MSEVANPKATETSEVETTKTSDVATGVSKKVPAANFFGVWYDLIGQDQVVNILQAVVANQAQAMTHAWLFTGPPGSGRSNAAKAFAAALQCDDDGCGECQTCRTMLSGSHPDVTFVTTDALSIKVDEVRDLVRKAAMSPTSGKYQIIIVEDCDRMTEQAANALLKALEEPAPRTVWMLCAPAARDVVVTVASRCRQVNLIVPPPQAISALIQRRDNASAELADYAARVAQGHIGRARALARDESVRNRRNEIMGMPSRLKTTGTCFAAASSLLEAAQAEASEISSQLDDAERQELEDFINAEGKPNRSTQAALKALEEKQKARSTRLQRDSLDRVLTELASYFRDVLVVQTAYGQPLVNQEQRVDIEYRASIETPQQTISHLDAILACRRAISRNVPQLLAIETLLLQLKYSE